jgi:hypothetical protein
MTAIVQADLVPTGHQGFIAFSPSTTNTGNINTATTFMLGSWTSTRVSDGIFVGMQPQDFGDLFLDTTIPTSLSFGNAVFGTFASTSITKEAAPTGTASIFATGNWTPGTHGGVTGGPFASELTLSLTQTPANTGSISASATFATPQEKVPEPSTFVLLLTGLAGVVLSYQLCRHLGQK